MTQTLTIAHSPDADDIFMAYGLASGTVTIPGIRFDCLKEDIEVLNQRALEGVYPVTAISFGVYPYIRDRYRLMTVGASMGEADYGPVVVARSTFSAGQLANATIAVPGRYTSATLFLKLAALTAKTVIMPFHEILSAVTSGRVDAGLLIHESQLQFAAKGCHVVLDLPAWWHQKYELPTPLGTNAIRRDLDDTLQSQLTTALRDSIRYALDHRAAALQHTQALREDHFSISFLDRYVGMYVNQRTLSIGTLERQAVQTLYDAAFEAGLFTERLTPEWV
jgi:1,4-dihydroxy-6-naphthoate synthase